MKPQSVPRGFLRWYILAMLDEAPETGYSIMQKIAERTEGAWRPGPGTVYPLLRGLKEQGLIEAVGQKVEDTGQPCKLTAKGKKELDDLQRNASSSGRNENALMRLFLGIMPPEAFTAMALNRSRQFISIFCEKADLLQEPKRSATLREMQLILENYSSDIERLLGEAGKNRNSRRAPKPN